MRRGCLRRFHPPRDLKQIHDLAEVAYAKDYARIGRSSEAHTDRPERGSSSVGTLASTLASLRDFNQGYIWEEGGQISAFVLYSRAGSGGDQWSIEALATHPEFRRKGLARRLLMEALTDLRRRDGKICTLKVRDTNDAAYALYRDLGFIHFDTAVYLRNDSLRPALPRIGLGSGLYS